MAENLTFFSEFLQNKFDFFPQLRLHNDLGCLESPFEQEKDFCYLFCHVEGMFWRQVDIPLKVAR